ncbi:Ecdysteroid-regulated 16 kDa protein [Gryllus bimaculatus]|nr:Ecdysteroid-regulated 16 kDa protein [Gryllus bimaculatus]
MHSFYYIVGVIFVATSYGFPVKDCGSKEGKLAKVSLSCSGDTECILKRNSNVTITMQFTPLEDVKELTALVHGIIEGLPVPFPLPNPNACEDSGIQCPLKKGNVYNYSAHFFVKHSYPKVRVTVKWEMKDENKNDLLCLLIPARIR